MQKNYQAQLSKNQNLLTQVKSQAKWISFARLITMLIMCLFIYAFFKTYALLYLAIVAVVLVGFIFLVKYATRLSWRIKLLQALVDINEDELRFIELSELPFRNGEEFIDPNHAYSFDLDFFGDQSLFHVLNRTETFVGRQKLASQLQTLLQEKEVLLHQKAIQELTQELAWRQELAALGKVTNDSKEVYENLENWTQLKTTKTSALLHLVSYFMPALVIGLTIYNSVFDAGLGTHCLLLFLFNLVIFSRQLKAIKKELINSTKIDRTLKNYSLIVAKIETKNFKSETLIKLQNRLNGQSETASLEIKKLSRLFDQLESIMNPFGAILFNGFLLFHLHTLRGFQNWKNQNAHKIMDWLTVIGEIEALSSLANYAYNNPEFVYPRLNSDYTIAFQSLGHPLLKAEHRVCSDVRFDHERFIILTGSNMSGKSTFLRSLGVNMVLAGTGAPICASEADFHPLPVYVSMRVSDSLNDNASFFFAEVKRLKEVMDAADKKVTFVLLDEILRGTNSDDKRTGTVEVVKKILAKKAIGAIATHDLKVCEMTADFPHELTNKCFEVEIVNDELYFDYKLREGVCKNKSATFLMKKMGVI